MIDLPQALPQGTVLVGDFRIEEALGAGGFGITYRGRDLHLNRDVAIKEYFPRMFAHREDGVSVRASSGGDGDNYEWGLARFLQEAQMLAQLKHPNLVGVTRYFKENNTAYLVLELLDGQDMDRWLKANAGPLMQSDLDRLAGPLLDALQTVHENGILHRDVKPANIFIRAADGEPVLIDFGASRHAIGEHTGTTAAIASPGYSPPESYSGKASHQGAWSDVYGCAASFYRAITGQPPEVATSRLLQDDYVPAAQAVQNPGSYRPGFLAAIDSALALAPKDRPQSAAAFRQMLARPEAAAETVRGSRPVSRATDHRRAPPPTPAEPARRSGFVRGLVAVVVVVGVAVAGYLYWSRGADAELAAWNQAIALDTPEAINSYLSRWPDGGHALEAKRRLAALEQQARAAREAEERARAERERQAAEERRRREQEQQQRADEQERRRQAELRQQEDQRRAEEEARRRREASARQSDLHASIKSFLVSDYLNSGFTLRELASLYGPVVDYYGRKDTPRAAVIKDKVAYGLRWPIRRYTLQEETLSITPLSPGDQTYSVAYNVDFDLAGRDRQSAGVAESNLVLQIIGGRPVIISEDGRVLQRR